MNKKVILFFTILLFQNNIFAEKIGTYGSVTMPFMDMTNQFAQGFVDFKYGFSINEGFATFQINNPIKKTISFAHENAILELQNDISFDSEFAFSFLTSSLSLKDSKNYGSLIWSLDWSPDGNYLAIGGYGPTSGNELQIYSFNSATGTLSANPVDSKNYGSYIFSVDWSPDGNYLAIGGNAPTSGNELQIYSFNSATGILSANPVDSKNYGSYIFSVDWSPDGSYLAIGGDSPTSGNELQIYSFNSATGILSANPVDSKNYGNTIWSVDWSPDGNYLAIGGQGPTSGNELQIYSFNSATGTLSANPVDSKNYGTRIYSVNWSPDGSYLAIGGDSPTSGNELQIYSFNSATGILSANPVDSKNYGSVIYSVDWSPDGNYLAIGGNAPTSGNELQIYSFNSATEILSANPVGSKSYGFVIYSVDWSPDGDYLAIGGSGPTSGDELQIYKLPKANSGNVSGNEKSMIFNGNLTIPNNGKLEFLTNTIIDGQNKILELEDNAQLIVDSNVTLTLRNLILQTGMNSDKKPIKLYLDGSLCLQNTKIILDDDFIFDSGNLFINEDTYILGPYQFIYSSTHKCHINKNSNLNFMQDSTFTYSPNSANRNLIEMKDKSSKLILKNCALTSTYTGLRLTRGNLILDGIVTVTPLDINTEIENIQITHEQNIQFEDHTFSLSYQDHGYAVDFSPDGKYLATGGSWFDGIGCGRIYKINSDNDIQYHCSIPYTSTIAVLRYSPNGNFLGVGGNWYNTLTNYNFCKIYPIDSDGYTGTAKEIPYGWQTQPPFIPPDPEEYKGIIKDLAWANNSNLLAVAGWWKAADSPSVWNGLMAYPMDSEGNPGSAIKMPIVNHAGEAIDISPDGNFLAASGWFTPRIFRLYPNNTVHHVGPIDYPTSGFSAALSIKYSPDQSYIVLGGWNSGYSNDTIRIYKINLDGTASDYWALPSKYATYSLNWSPDGKSLLAPSCSATDDYAYHPIYELDLKNRIINGMQDMNYGDTTGYIKPNGSTFSPDNRLYALAGDWSSTTTSKNNIMLYSFAPDYKELREATFLYGNSKTEPPSLRDNYITFGNAAAGNSENLYIDVLSGAKVDVHGILNIENVA